MCFWSSRLRVADLYETWSKGEAENAFLRPLDVKFYVLIVLWSEAPMETSSFVLEVAILLDSE